MPRKTFKEFIPEVTGQLKPMLDTFLQALGIRRGKEEVGRLQKMEKMGRVTTGFVPEMYREVGEQVGLEETGFRAEHQKSILDRAMELFGISEQWERQQAQIQSTEKMGDLNRQLTKQGWSFQARQSELDRQLTKEGWDRQSRENVLSRVFTAEQSELDRALQRELNRLSGAGGDGITFPTITGGGAGKVIPDSFIGVVGEKPPLSLIAQGLAKRGAYKAPTPSRGYTVGLTTRNIPKPTTYRASTPTYQAPATTYRGTRLRRI